MYLLPAVLQTKAACSRSRLPEPPVPRLVLEPQPQKRKRDGGSARGNGDERRPGECRDSPAQRAKVREQCAEGACVDTAKVKPITSAASAGRRGGERTGHLEVGRSGEAKSLKNQSGECKFMVL